MNGTVRKTENVERIARFHSLQAGEFWKAKDDIADEGITAGDTLLLMSIRWVEDQAHTIILRAHPRHYDEYIYVEVKDAKGEVKRTPKRMLEHRFLVNDFLNKFEFEPDHQQIRQAEIASVHEKIALIQKEMSDTMTTPAIMKDIVEEQLKADQENERAKQTHTQKLAPPPALYDEAIPLVTGTVQNALAQGITSESITAMKLAAKREHRIAEIQSSWLESKKSQINNTIKQLMPYFNEMPAAALAKTEDVREYVDKLQSGIKSIYLYTGENVTIVPVNKGESAPPEIPLTFVQKKLIVEEELAVWADVDEWFDFRSTELFFKALNEHPALVDQIFPAQRCVLVMAMTNHDVDYGEPWTNEERNKENRKVFLMVRDGENIYQVFSPVESHLGSHRLFPSQDESESIFKGFDGTQIKFDDVAYTDRLRGFDLRALHYKRFLILICGLDHREKLFGEFYNEPPSMNFVSMKFQEEYCRFLHDDDGAALLAAVHKRPSLNEYIRSVNAYMRSGSRMLCNWGSILNPATAPGACKQDNHSRYRDWYLAAEPEHSISLSVAYRKGQAICVDVPVKRQHSDSWFNCKVELSALNDYRYESEDNQLPYLCLDSIEADDLEWYVLNRKYRSNHIFYIRFFKMAIKYIRAERAAEKDVRDMMLDALNEGAIGTKEERPSLVQQSVVAWRAAQRGVPLNEALNDKKSWQSLLNQMYMLAGNADNEIEGVANFVKQLGYKPLRLVVNATGKLAVYAESLPQERDERIEKHIWVHRINIIRGKRKIRETSRSWAVLPESLAAESTVHQWDEAQEWTGKTSLFNSFNSKQKVFDRVDKSIELLKLFSGIIDRDAFIPIFEEWREAYNALVMKNNRIVKPHLLIPFGYRIRDVQQNFLCVGVVDAERLLYKLAPDQSCRDAVLEAYMYWYADDYKDHFRQEFLRGVEARTSFSLFSSGDANISNERMFNVAGDPHRMLGSDVMPDSFDDAVSFYLAEADRKKTSLFISPRILNEDGSVGIDRMLNIAMPDTYQPVDLVNIHLNDYRRFRSISDDDKPQCRYAATDEEVKYPNWYDICSRSVPTERLIAGVISNDITVRRLPFNNQEAAMAYIKRKNYHNEFKLLSEVEDVPEAANPPEGVIRLVR